MGTCQKKNKREELNRKEKKSLKTNGKGGREYKVKIQAYE